VAAALDADVYENWTDVPGILMADPRIVPDPKPLDCVTYAELRELSGIGTQVLHEDTIAPVREKNIPINIRDTNAPSLPGTMICSELPAASPVRKLTGIFGRRHCILVSIRKTGLGTKPGDFTALLQVLDGYELPVLYYVGGIDRLTLLLSQKAEPQSLELLSQTLRRSGQAESVQITENISALATVSRSLAQDPAIAGRVLCTLCADGIPVSLALQAQPGLSFLAAVPDDRFEEAIRSLYTEFIQD
jgi:aspartate kinase